MPSGSPMRRHHLSFSIHQTGCSDQSLSTLMIRNKHVITLPEYSSTLVSTTEVSESDAKIIDRTFGKQLTIESANFRHPDAWELSTKGWIGYLPISDSL